MLRFSHKQIVALIASLVILLAQFASLAHATEHPFHTEDSQCIVYQNAEQNKHLSVEQPLAVSNIVVSYCSPTGIGSHPVLSGFSLYLSRAPPAQTI